MLALAQPHHPNEKDLQRLTRVARVLDSLRGNSFLLLMIAPLLQPVFGVRALIAGAVVGVLVLTVGRWHVRVLPRQILDLALLLRSEGTISKNRLEQTLILVNRITSDGPRRAGDPVPILDPHTRVGEPGEINV